MRIGENILKIRKEKGLKRSELVKKLSFIYGNNAVEYRTIERLERGDIVRGHLSTLLQIADCLDVELDKLVKGPDEVDKLKQEELKEEVCLTRSNSRGGIFRYNDKASLEIISPQESSYIVFLLSLEPKGKTKLEQDPQGTVKFLLVMEGEIKAVVGNLERVLSKGDSLQINSHKPHYFENKSKKKSLALLYQNPKHF